ncbi:M20/M25/M40 family metallo-hydrolase, partial [Kocuria sp.]|uniref:M20/M25/M40 family metallo-hydrolase n=1 Tax=Kocuria sp. TaxID=1871328 RepID=UPI0026DFD1BF
MASTHVTEQILQGQSNIKDWQEELYKDFHAHPELGFHEERTSAVVAEKLNEFGFEVHDKVGPTGVVGVLSNGDGPVVLMRADMDALPVKEATGLDYASTETFTDENGNTTPVMHACGHDVHVSSLLGAARLMSESKDAWQGTFIALFQPAEELGTGAQSMV